MNTLQLKHYQQTSLDELGKYLRQASQTGCAIAFRQSTGRPYSDDAFGNAPRICLRIPTSGGKARFGWVMKTQEGISMALQLEKLLVV